jgi:cytochrome P450
MIYRATMHDPAIFPEPERFYPELWLSPDAPAYPTTAFGFGVRRYPGRLLAHANVWLMIVGIIAVFDITQTEDGPPEEIYMSGILSCAVSGTVQRIE